MVDEVGMNDRQLVEVSREFRRGLLSCESSEMMCMIVSSALGGYLSAVFGIECEVEEVDFGHTNHVWLKLADGRILDPTADQFGLPAVYLGEVPEKYKEWMG